MLNTNSTRCKKHSAPTCCKPCTAGAPLVPVFAFGQTDMFKWLRLGPPLIPKAAMLKIARRMGFLPLLLYGVWGSTLTFPVPVHVVIGQPIDLPRVDDPSQEQIEAYLQRFIQAMSRLFDKHKGNLGHGHLQLEVM